MHKLKLPDLATYSFADYFRMNIPVDQLADYFGYKFTRIYQQLPHSTTPLTRLEDLQLRLQSNTLHTSILRVKWRDASFLLHLSSQR